MFLAASLPQPMAVVTLDAPVTKSPPAKTLSRLVVERVAVDLEHAVAGDLEAGPAAEVPVDAFADRQDDAVAADVEHLAGVDGSSSSGCVERAEQRLGHLDRLDRARLHPRCDEARRGR